MNEPLKGKIQILRQLKNSKEHKRGYGFWKEDVQSSTEWLLKKVEFQINYDLIDTQRRKTLITIKGFIKMAFEDVTLKSVDKKIEETIKEEDEINKLTEDTLKSVKEQEVNK